jgi:hypothetical protein
LKTKPNETNKTCLSLNLRQRAMSDVLVYWYNILMYVCRGFFQLLSMLSTFKLSIPPTSLPIMLSFIMQPCPDYALSQPVEDKENECTYRLDSHVSVLFGHHLQNLTTFMCRLPCNLGASTSWKPQALHRPVMGLLYHHPQRDFRTHSASYVYLMDTQESFSGGKTAEA